MTALSSAEVREYYRHRAPKLHMAGGELRGPCLLHNGMRDSLSVNAKTGEWFCHSQCDRGGTVFDFEAAISGLDGKQAYAEVFRIVGRPASNGAGKRLVAEYSYVDEDGNLLFQCLRFEPKGFSQRRPDGTGGWIRNLKGVRRVLYRLPAVLAAEIVFVVEGEKDANALVSLGVEATCNPMGAGAGKWCPEYSEFLRGKEVFVIPDADEAGREHATTVLRSLAGVASSARLLALPGAKDASEWIERGGTLDALIELATQAREKDRDHFEGPRHQWRYANENGRRPPHADVVNDWPEPSPLGCELPPVQAFSTSLLPEVLRGPVEDLAERMQVPVDYAAICTVIGLAGAVNRRARIQPKRLDSTWIVVPNLWGGIIGPPGFLKSPVLKAATASLVRVEDIWRQLYAGEIDLYESEKENADLRLSAWKERSKSAFKQGKGQPVRPDNSLRPPVQKRLILGDSTFEKTHELMAENPAGLLVLRDELTGWLAQLDKPGREGERAFSLECWNGDSGLSIDRIGRGSIYVPACCLSMLGGITPAGLRGYLCDVLKDAPGNDGLIQRFQLLVWPDAPAGWEYVDRLPQANRIGDMLTRLTALDAEDPILYTFDDAAQGLFVDWLADLERRIRADRMHPALIAYLAKQRKTMPSLATLFALADGQEPPAGAQHAFKSIRWCQYLESHARRIYSCVVDARMQAAAVLAARLRDGTVGADGTFARRDIYRHHWAGLETPEQAADALEILRDAGWVRRKPSEVGTGRPSDLWEINPKVNLLNSP
jgi:putative DNA primase/helicase